MSMDDPARPVTDDDRRGAVTELRRAAEDGRLQPAELDARLEQVAQARLNGQLGAALEGIPQTGATWPVANTPYAPAPQAAAQLQHPTGAPAGYRPDDRLVLSAGMTNEKREGRWTVPPFLRCQPGMANIKLDCREATPAADVIDVQIGIGAGNVVFIVPPGWGVNTDRLGKGIGSIKVRVPRNASPGCPTLVFHGQLGMGDLKVREENWIERKLAKD